MNKFTKPLFEGSEWTFALLHKTWEVIDSIGKELGLDYYKPQIEVINAEQMIDAYCIAPTHKLLRKDLRWINAAEIKVGDVVLGFDEHQPHRKYREGHVLKKEEEGMMTYKVLLSSGKVFTVTGNHQWLVRKNRGKACTLEWVKTNDLKVGQSQIPKLCNTWTEMDTKDAGWLAGLFDGEGYLLRGIEKLSVSQNPGLILDRITSILDDFKINYSKTEKHSDSRLCKDVNILGHRLQKLEFLGRFRAERLINKISFEELGTLYTSRNKCETVRSITPNRKQTIIKITTSCGTFVCDGYPMHNSSVAMPLMYDHWSFGKSFIQNKKAYDEGRMGLAYEVVINTNPSIAYLMEANTMTMQTLVMAHASVGHSSFFKTNHLFADGVDAATIIPYLKFAKDYIKKCEEQHGIERVQMFLDACHSLRNFGVDRHKRSEKLSKEELTKRRDEWWKHAQETYDPIMPKDTQVEYATLVAAWHLKHGVTHRPESNILYFIQKYAPNLQEWEREIIRIVRKLAQYFYPQMQTQLMNEGWATFIHYTIMNTLYDRGAINDGSYLEFLHNHCAVIYQPPHQVINVYALGFAMMRDIRRMCEDPTDEDKKWCPDVCNTEWVTTMKRIIVDFRDESFILQYLSPKVIRDMKLCALYDKEGGDSYEVTQTHSDEDVLEIRQLLSNQFSIVYQIPNIEVQGVDWDHDRTLELSHTLTNNQQLKHEDTKKTMGYIRSLWGFDAEIFYRNPDGSLFQGGAISDE